MRSTIFKRTNHARMRGFSLIELLVSITLFTFVALVAIASLVGSTQLNTRLKVTRNLYENMYFTMEEITRELKQGNMYNLISPTEISFTPYQPYSPTFYKTKYALVNGVIHSYRDNGFGFVDTGEMTNSDINITSLRFEVVGGGDFASGDRQQPAVKIILKGETKTYPYSEFAIESFVTQRDTDQ